MKVRAKVRCSWKDMANRQVYFYPVCDGSPENVEFFKSTPGGQVQLYVVSESAFAVFEQNKEYYLDFTLADPR